MPADASSFTPSLEGLIKLLADRPDDDKRRVLGTLACDLLAKQCEGEIAIASPDGSTVGYLVSSEARQQLDAERLLVAELDRRMRNPGRLSTPGEVLARLQASSK